VGKVVVAFSLFLAASALAIHEAKPPPAPPSTRPAPARVEPALPAFREAPPWLKYAAPPAAPTPPAPRVVVAPGVVAAPPPPPVLTVSEGDAPDAEDRCPDQPTDDDDGCPEPIILVE
jgi:hypothetical protein